MSLRHLLLPLSGEAPGADVALFALVLAKQLGAHVTAAFNSEVPVIGSIGDLTMASVAGRSLFGALDPFDDRRKSARLFFDAAVARIKLPIVSAPVCRQASTMWIDDPTEQYRPIADYGSLTDLIVMEAPGNRASRGAWRAVETALFRTHRPALILPLYVNSPNFSKVLVAWNGSAEVANAVVAAVGLLPAKAQVTVVQIGALAADRLPAQRIMTYLGCHGFDAVFREVTDNPNNTAGILLDEARRAEAGCVIMGAYTHSRTRESFLGGLTNFMLQHSYRPVLMAH